MGRQGMGFEDVIKKLDADDNNTCDSDKDNTINCTNNNTYKALVSYITALPPKQFILLSSMIGILLIDDLDATDQLILGKFINNIGQTILTSAAQQQINKKSNKN